MSREQRKLDHIRYALELGDGPLPNGFTDMHFLHNCLPELAPADSDITTTLGGIKLSVPFLINAITGGTDNVIDINRKLAQTAKSVGAAIAVGSQYGAVKSKSSYQSFKVVREVYPNGVVFANVSALATPDEAAEAVKMLDADALQVHLNPAQELVMPEGDRNFKGLLDNMRRILEHSEVPVIVKETGCGMAAEQIKQMLVFGFTWFDIGGAGGTNFPAIEAKRFTSQKSVLAEWGINTAKTLTEAFSVCGRNDIIIASGGIRDGLTAAKAFALSADVVGMSGNILRYIIEKDIEEAQRALTDIINDLKMVMLLTGSSDLKALRNAPIYFTGELREFLLGRNYDISKISAARKR